MNSPNNANQQGTIIAVALGMVMLIGFGVAFFFMRGMSVMMLMSGGIFFLILILAVVFVMTNQAKVTKSGDEVPDWLGGMQSKAKRADEVDMYSLIDDLIDDLTEDEARYLMRKLDDHQRQKLTTNIEDLLQDRRKNRR